MPFPSLGYRLPFLLASAPALVAATASGGVTGRVLDERGQPVARARVRFENRVSGFRQEVVTDGSGGRRASLRE